MVHRDPRSYGRDHTRWRLRDLPRVVPHLRGYSLSGLSRLVHRLGLSFQRGQHRLHSPDPAYAEKMARIARATALATGAPGRVTLLYGDEVSFYRQPTLAPCVRQHRDGPTAWLSHRTNTRYRIAGMLNQQTGQVTTVAASQCRVPTMQRVLRTVRAAYPDQHLLVVWDNWPVHHHPAVVAEAARLHITLLWLPTYAPWENPIEKLWRWLKQEVLHHHRFADDWPGLKAAVTRFLDRFALPSPALLRYVGLLPD